MTRLGGGAELLRKETRCLLSRQRDRRPVDGYFDTALLGWRAPLQPAATNKRSGSGIAHFEAIEHGCSIDGVQHLRPHDATAFAVESRAQSQRGDVVELRDGLVGQFDAARHAVAQEPRAEPRIDALQRQCGGEVRVGQGS